jgi:hypothetical protein
MAGLKTWRNTTGVSLITIIMKPKKNKNWEIKKISILISNLQCP